jgi:hypothetical protein
LTEDLRMPPPPSAKRWNCATSACCIWCACAISPAHHWRC